VDQNNGPVLPNWGHPTGTLFDVGIATALAFDPTSGMVLVAIAGSDDTCCNYGYHVLPLDPVSGDWGDDLIPLTLDGAPTSISALAVEPTTGDLYFLRSQGVDAPTTTFVHHERATGQETEIASWPPVPWQLRFADAKYVRQ
jgi:hypothetical protein